jgi:hypothetical protein
MSFNRTQLSAEFASETLTGAMVGIGMNFAAPALPNPNIEDTLFFASIEGMERDDLRVLSVLMTWLSVHTAFLNADRLIKLVEATDRQKVKAFWSAFAAWQKSDRRFAKMANFYQGPRLDLVVGTAFQIGRHGEDKRLQEGPLRVPAHTLREREGDVLLPHELALRHRAYYFRVMMGPGYRADAWAELTLNPLLSAADLARKTYSAFATAWRVKRDFSLLCPSSAQNEG